MLSSAVAIHFKKRLLHDVNVNQDTSDVSGCFNTTLVATDFVMDFQAPPTHPVLSSPYLNMVTHLPTLA